MKQAYRWSAENRVTRLPHLFRFAIPLTDTDGTFTLTTLSSTSPLLPSS